MINRLGRAYRIEQCVGEGGFGSVYKAVQTSLDRTVAIKTLREELAGNPRYAASFQAQARLMAGLEHPNIVRFYDAGEYEGIKYITMQYIDGRTLDSILFRRGSLAPSEAIEIARQVAEALVYAHKRGAIHGDLNPGNIILANDNTVYVTDFGGSDLAEGRDEVVGVPEYVSPEQARGGEAIAASDMYSLGVIIYHMLCGRPPFSGTDARDTLNAHISAKIPRIRRIAHRAPRRLVHLTACLLAKNPEDRPAAGVVRDVLREMASSPRPVKAAKLDTARQPMSLGRKLAAAMMVPVVLGCALTGMMIFHSVQTERSIDKFAVKMSSTAKNLAEEERKRRIEAEYSKQFVEGQGLYSEKRYGLAEQAFIRASHLKPKSTDPRMFLAAIYIDKGQYEKAYWHLATVVRMDPRKRQAQDALAFVRGKLQATPVELAGQ